MMKTTAPVVSGLAHCTSRHKPDGPLLFQGLLIRGRFHAQALLDERKLIAAAAYVDLNPVRAAMARSLEASRHINVPVRIAQQQA